MPVCGRREAQADEARRVDLVTRITELPKPDGDLL